jgi:hypothetical protein
MTEDGNIEDGVVSWFALAVVPRKEKATAQALRAKGYPEFLPMYTVRRRWSDRVQNVEQPEPIPDVEIDALQTVCKAGVNTIPYPYLTAGAKVRINEGPLTGVEGILLESKQTRLILSVTLLQRSIAVEVDAEWIAPVRTLHEF